ncbi:glycine-rich cell wall structural protein 1.0-like [Trifolium pratense]|uniref:glycine-rich cell wall structural protein 1.0-like n=1 Tax=Trifolium pratense TaxID=57577 RepID=UPI001E697AF1|nr:glycine-rich cell wall structural protein 1.0-like [Trifolium pratense]
MKTIHFIFFALLNFVVPIEPSQDVKQIGETEESKASIRVDSYAYWPGRGAIWKGNEGGKTGWWGGGKGYADGAWGKVRPRGTEWWEGGKSIAGQNAGKGRLVQPIPGGGNGAGGGNVKKIIGGVNKGGSGKGDGGGNFIELLDDENMTYGGKADSSEKIRGALSSMVKDSTKN